MNLGSLPIAILFLKSTFKNKYFISFQFLANLILIPVNKFQRTSFTFYPKREKNPCKENKIQLALAHVRNHCFYSTPSQICKSQSLWKEITAFHISVGIIKRPSLQTFEWSAPAAAASALDTKRSCLSEILPLCHSAHIAAVYHTEVENFSEINLSNRIF